MYVKLSFNFIIFYYFHLNFLQANPIVKIDQGFLSGTIFETRTRKISAFLGIPYAQPPIADLRFKNPVPGKRWDGIRSVAQTGNSCAQIALSNKIGEEDCLYLNVFTPILSFNSSMNKLLPVMVWIHGGGFFFGTSSHQYFGPKYLLDKDIILVSMNYRLGIFGFFTTGDSVAPGNFGMKDQVLALKWVQKNIRNFGGNPRKVTIFGESAGGASVSLHALSDSNHGLFHQYVIQSGSALSPWIFRNKQEYKSYINEVAANVGCLNETSQLLVNCLRNKSVESLLKAKPQLFENFPFLIWIPTDESESENAFLTDSPKNLISRNKMKDLPFMSGTVVDEGILTTVGIYRNETIYIERLQYLVENLINLFSSYYSNLGETVKFRKIIEDYYFNEHCTLFRKIRKNVGVPHAAELSYLFFKNSSETMSNKDKKILNLMVDLWTSFAINGKPSSDILEDPYLWQSYGKNRNFLQIGNILNNTDPSVTMENNYFSSRMDFWRKEFPMLLN